MKKTTCPYCLQMVVMDWCGACNVGWFRDSYWAFNSHKTKLVWRQIPEGLLVVVKWEEKAL